MHVVVIAVQWWPYSYYHLKSSLSAILLLPVVGNQNYEFGVASNSIRQRCTYQI
jgi:hypothetical protein